MKQPFYYSAIDAASMAQNYEMQFILEQNNIKWGMRNTHEILHEFMQGNLDTAKFYIWDESLPILEPQLGDLVQMSLREPGSEEYEIFYREITTLEQLPIPGFARIIERDGKPFIWPSFE